jgi:dihydropyrimidinase
MKVKGWPVMTIIRGQIVVRDERLQVLPGFGKFIRRKTVDYDSIR